MKRNRTSRSFIFGILIIALLVTFTGCGQKEDSTNPANEQVSIVDMAGRTVEIPAHIDKVFSSGTVGTVFLYTLDPEKMIGWNNELSNAQKQIILPAYRDLPVLGTYRMNKPSSNTEEIMKAAPDLIISMGDVAGKYVEEADWIQEMLGIPVVMVDGSLEKSGEAYRFLGSILGVDQRAEELAQYCDTHWEQVTEQVASINEDQRKSIYYATSVDGLTTSPQGSINTELIDLAGGINVADAGMLEQGRFVEVSLEQVLAWDADVILITPEGADTYQHIMTSSDWEQLQAVQQGEVYEIPALPFDWFNRPPSVNKIIGLHWLSNLLYPDQIVLDIHQETKDFLKLFYQVDADDKLVDEILKLSIRK